MNSRYTEPVLTNKLSRDNSLSFERDLELLKFKVINVTFVLPNNYSIGIISHGIMFLRTCSGVQCSLLTPGSQSSLVSVVNINVPYDVIGSSKCIIINGVFGLFF